MTQQIFARRYRSYSRVLTNNPRLVRYSPTMNGGDSPLVVVSVLVWMPITDVVWSQYWRRFCCYRQNLPMPSGCCRRCFLNSGPYKSEIRRSFPSIGSTILFLPPRCRQKSILNRIRFRSMTSFEFHLAEPTSFEFSLEQPRRRAARRFTTRRLRIQLLTRTTLASTPSFRQPPLTTTSKVPTQANR